MSADWAASVWLMHGCGLRVGETLAVRCNIGRLCRGRADCAEIAVAPRLITPRGGRRHRLAACWQSRQDGAVTDQSTGGDTVWGALVFDRRVGWRSLRVRRWRQYARVDTTLPADDDQLLTTLLGAGSALRFATGGAGTRGAEHRISDTAWPADPAAVAIRVAGVAGPRLCPRPSRHLAGQGRRKASSGPGPPLRLSASPDRRSCHERTAQKSRSSSAPGRPSCSVIHQ